MSYDSSEQLQNAIFEIRDLIRLIAEPQIAARDEKLRNQLLQIVGKSAPKSKAVFLMNGSHTQVEIRKKIGIHAGDLSTLVKMLAASKLLQGDIKQPNLSIAIPTNFFEATKR